MSHLERLASQDTACGQGNHDGGKLQWNHKPVGELAACKVGETRSQLLQLTQLWLQAAQWTRSAQEQRRGSPAGVEQLH